MHKDLEKRITSTPPKLIGDGAIRAYLMKLAERVILRFPRFVDSRLYAGLERLIVNTSKNFLSSRSIPHLRKLLLIQFFLQKKMEAAIEQEGKIKKLLFLKLFKHPSIIGVAFTFHSSYRLHRDEILKSLQTLLPSLHEIPLSAFFWQHPEQSYFFYYFEVRKLRGKELSKNELCEIEKMLREQLLAIPSLTPILFWPYNEEESYRQIQLLQKEMNTEEDLPHVSIQFQEQTPSSLEFLVHIVRPLTQDSLTNAVRMLPDSIHCFCRFYRLGKIPFSIELGAYSIKIPSIPFEMSHSINLLYARRYVSKHIETVIGPFRDYNGGLFEKQQHHFEFIRIHLKEKILHFDLFAEKVFYALHPVEMRFSMSLSEAEELFNVFSMLLQGKETHYYSEKAIAIRLGNSSDQAKLDSIVKDSNLAFCHAQIALGDFHYFCFLGPGVEEIKPLLLNISSTSDNLKNLRLIFQEGAPLSLNPYYSAGDMRCRVLAKLLFEGLTRLNALGEPELAGAVESKCSDDGRLYTFTLRPYRWSNGENVTAIDYAMSWQSVLSDLVSHPEHLFIIKNARQLQEKKCSPKELGVRALDNETLEIELERPDPHFLYRLAQPSFAPLFGSMREPKWFNGPYLIREQSKDGLLLERNPYFWDGKRSFFEQIDVRWEGDDEKIQEMFKEGKIDWIGDPISVLSNQFVHELVEEKKLMKREVKRRFLVCFNTMHPILASQSIRRALSLAIDRAWICRTIFPGSIPLEPLAPLREEANAWFEKGLKELGLTRNTFPSLIFTYSLHQTRRELLASFLQSIWQGILGINIRLEKSEWNLFRNKLEKGDFEITGTIQDTIAEGTAEFFERFEGSNSWNFSRWTHQGYRELIKKAKEESNVLHRQEIFNTAQQMLEIEVPFTPLFNYIHLYAHNPLLDGYHIDREGCVDFGIASLKKG